MQVGDREWGPGGGTQQHATSKGMRLHSIFSAGEKPGKALP